MLSAVMLSAVMMLRCCLPWCCVVMSAVIFVWLGDRQGVDRVHEHHQALSARLDQLHDQQ